MADYTLSAKITGDASGFRKAFETAEATVIAFSKKIENIGSKLSGIGSKLTNSITKPALAAATALAAVPLVKGWNRMTQIDEARVKLEALGNSAKEVDSIMDNALASVKGTAYGMDEAATTAANAVAAGIQPGKELERYLKNIADAASVAGADMSEMGSIFNKCATTNAAYNEELQQLSDRGLPIYTWLAEAAGVSAAEIKEMASQGEISCADLQNAIETHIDGAAKTMGSKTITGALSNISAAISRIGANFLGSSNDASSFAGKVLPALNNITAYLGTIEEKAKEWGAVFGEVFSALTSYCTTGSANLSGLSDSAGRIVSKLTPVIGVVKSVTTEFASLSTKGKLGLLGAVVFAGSVISAMGKVITAVSGSANAFKTVKTAVSALSAGFSPILLIIAAVAAAFAYLMTTNDEFRGSVISMVDALLSSLTPVLQQIAGALTLLLTGLLPPLLGIIQSIAPLISTIIAVLATVIPPIMSIVSVAIEAVTDIITNLMPIIDTVSNVIATVMAIVMPIVSFVADIIAGIVSVVSPLVGVIVTVFGNILSGISNVMSNVLSVVSNVFAKMRSAWSGLTGFVGGVFSGISSAVSTLVGKVKGFVNGVIGGINAAIGIINAIPGVRISKIPQLAHGTDNWQGGFAYMNESGRGELTYLPNGAQVIPHDISVKYAKEAARVSSGAGDIDLSGFMEGMIISINNNTSVDGTPLKEIISDYTIQKIGNQQKAVQIARGAY